MIMEWKNYYIIYTSNRRSITRFIWAPTGALRMLLTCWSLSVSLENLIGAEVLPFCEAGALFSGCLLNLFCFSWNAIWHKQKNKNRSTRIYSQICKSINTANICIYSSFPIIWGKYIIGVYLIVSRSKLENESKRWFWIS